MQSELVDTASALQAFLDGVADDAGKSPSLYVDLEGNNLSRHGTLSLVTIFVEPEKKVYLIDVTTLQQDAFDTAGSNGRTLRAVLESDRVTKVFFDIRNDSDALFSLYGVKVDGVEDLQLIELASRTVNRKHVNGLAKCIGKDSTIGYAEKQVWQKVKDKGRLLVDYSVFDERPLRADIRDYCTQDVTMMPHLRSVYWAKLCDAWWKKIEDETKARIQLSQSAGYNGRGQHKAEGPPEWFRWCPTPAERLSRRLFEPSPARAAPTASARPPPIHQQAKDDLTEALRLLSMGLRRLQDRARVVHDSTEPDGSDEQDELHERWDSEDDAAYTWCDLTACDSACGYCGHCP